MSKVVAPMSMSLGVYQPGHYAGYSFRSFRVDKNQDLTFVPVGDSKPDARIDSNACSVTFVELYRSGISSVAGKALPQAGR